MVDERNARPVSGETMSGKNVSGEIMSGEIMVGVPREAASKNTPSVDVIDADFVVLAGSPAATEPSHAAAATAIPSQQAPIDGMGMLKQDEAPDGRPFGARGGPIFWVAGLGLVAAAFWVSGGHALVRQAPFVVAPKPAAALRISEVDSRVDSTGAKPVLFVDGEAMNDGTAEAPMPALEIMVTDNSGQITRYRLGTSGRRLTPGERFAFSSRLDVPKNGVKTVSVGFAE
jgi:hypothetical protein